MNTSYGTAHSSGTPLVRAIHTAVHGRARYHVQGLQHSESLKQHLETYLLAEAGIQQVSASSVTGNLLVHFSSAWGARTIAQHIEQLVLQFNHYHYKPLMSEKPTATSPRLRHSSIVPRSPQLSRAISNFPTLGFMEQDFQAQRVEPWHLVDVEQVIRILQTSATSGLSHTSAKSHLQTYGPNLLPEATTRSWFSLLISQFKSLPVGLLTLAAGLSIATGGLADAVVIMGVVFINAVIGYATESQSERIIHSLKHLLQPVAWVIREGTLTEINAQEVVVGDILVLKPGSYVAADARLIEAHRLSVDESTLTGESLPVSKTVVPLMDAALPLGDRTNMVYMGTLITGGQGFAVVVATRQFTEMGRIQTLVGEAIMPATPMERQLDQAGGQLVLVSSAVCGLVFGIGMLRGYDVLQMLKTSISLAVAAVPEGLPAVATTTLALGIREMRRHKVLIRRLDAVETLGSVQALCLDKTGTLTINKMSVVELYVTDDRIQIADAQWSNGQEPIDPMASETLVNLLQVLVLCNESEINSTANSQVELKGSSTENALLELAIAAGMDVAKVRQTYPLLTIHHRSEARNVMLTLHQVPTSITASPKQLLAVKGSPMEVLSLCNCWIRAGVMSPLTQADRSVIAMANDRMAGRALRVLGVAYRYINPPEETIQDNLIWLGLVGMIDPLRPGTKELMQVFHHAGIETIMITGDQNLTAYAIGKELNLNQDQQLQILDSTAFTTLDPEIMQALCKQAQIFARISPAHKLQIVQALQRTGKVVAMTGDGINDAPALKAANVGVAMGHVGTDVAREVADIVLEDDNLQTMTIAVSRGRTIYHNIRKSVHFLLSTNLSEILVMLTAISLGLGQPLNAMQLLWLNLVTDIFPGLALALEPPAPDVLSQLPRDPNQPIIKPSDFKRILFESTTLSISALAAYSYAIGRYGISPRASTIGFMSLTCAQLFHALSCRSTRRRWGRSALPPNPYLTTALAGSLALQLLSAIVPGLRTLLHITPISFVDSAIISASAFLPLLVNEGTKRKDDRLGAWVTEEPPDQLCESNQ
ncbi:HAD-IC family P-type ATPase [Pantanalinema rosaneae CENA516]|uniref:cation-translocating P-type ATPase n=1 Tax=Pantanalinema rosaneae TaxID=1620701 RepID=UPI003D6EFD12